MGINFDGFNFTEPIKLSSWEPPFRNGVYVILTPDQNAKPKPFKALYFGESENMAERGFDSHHKKYCWVREAGAENKLYVAVYLMPNSTKNERLEIEKRLILKYKPKCNN